MKKAFYSGLAVLVLACLAGPAWAQKGGGGKARGAAAVSHRKASTRSVTGNAPSSVERSNKGGEVRGQERAAEVQSMNTKADTERGFTTAPGPEKAGQQAAQGGKGKHKGQVKDGDRDRDRGRDRDQDRDRDESRDQ